MSESLEELLEHRPVPVCGGLDREHLLGLQQVAHEQVPLVLRELDPYDVLLDPHARSLCARMGAHGLDTVLPTRTGHKACGQVAQCQARRWCAIRPGDRYSASE